MDEEEFQAWKQQKELETKKKIETGEYMVLCLTERRVYHGRVNTILSKRDRSETREGWQRKRKDSEKRKRMKNMSRSRGGRCLRRRSC
jgi:hypothetical protein